VSGETAAERLSPVQVSGLASGVTSIGAGDYHTCAIQANGTRVCWGQERSGKLGPRMMAFSTTRQRFRWKLSGLRSCAGCWRE